MSQASPKETPCPDCGEMVRVNSLRCWNCGAFMNTEVEQRFIAMQSGPRPIIFSEVPEGEMQSAGDIDDDDDDDFQLKTPIAREIPTPAQFQAPPEQAAPVASPESAATGPATSGPATSVDAPIQIKIEPEAEQPAAADDSPKAERRPQPDTGVAHSVATGGDALLDIAIQEEREVRKRSKGRKVLGGLRTPGGGLIIFCPYGCRVEVKETHRGMTGRCPRCQAPFIVPIDPPIFKKQKADGTAETGTAAGTTAAEKFAVWLNDLHLHVVDPSKLKLKADSLMKEFTEVDVAFSEDVLLVASLAKKGGGLFSKGGEKKEDVRSALQAYLAENKAIEEAPAGEKHLFAAHDVPQVKVVQPAPSRASSIFHGIPVFGTNRIAVQLPLNEKTEHPFYLSMGITEFWKFAKGMEEVYGITGLGDDLGLPMAPRSDVTKCHYTDAPIKALLDIDLYRADPTVQLEVAGYQCGACKMTVSEAGRKKENLGGKSPKGIAKAKCPKCGSKMGENLLYSFKEDVVDPSLASST